MAGGRRQTGLLVVALAATLAAWASLSESARAVPPASCGGATDGSMTRLLEATGSFNTAQEGSFVYLPFDVPAGTTAVRVRYCHDDPENALPSQLPNAPKHVLDLGLYDARPGTSVWGPGEFRGWAGSSTKDVTVSPNGFSDEATYSANKKAHVHGRTTRGYEPGQIPEGEWAVELGVAAVASQQEGDGTGEVGWRVVIDTSTSGDWNSAPYAPAAYDSDPADPDPGWYAGDFHVHGEHEPGNALMRETFRYAFSPLAPGSGGGAGLDFVTLVDHNNINAYGEIGRFQGLHPGKLIVRSTEVTTYRGHMQNHASGDFTDYRTGALQEATLVDDPSNADPAVVQLGTVTQVSGPRPASAILGEIQMDGGFTQINHPTIFPSAVPTFDDFCRGCSWEYSAAETDYTKVDAIEVATGPAGIRQQPHPGPNPFTPLAIQFWEDAIDSGGANSNKIAAVGSSDSHQAGAAADAPEDITGAPIGQATTAVFADELSEQGVKEAVQAGHTYVKVWGNDGPDLRFTAADPLSPGDPAIIGDTVQSDSTTFHAQVTGAGPGAARPGVYTLVVFKDGGPVLEIPITSDDFTAPDFPSFGLGRYRLQVMRLTTGVASVEAVSSPIYLEAPGGPSDTDADDDGVADDADNCPTVANGGQQDLDGDGLGDACDADRDGDAVADADDACPAVPGAAGNGGCPQGTPLTAGRCTVTRIGGSGADRLLGTSEGELLSGRRGRDRVFGAAGNDCLFGGPGADRIGGGTGSDVALGGKGRDRVAVADGEPDVVRCGRGIDRVIADSFDRVGAGCERVTRR